VVKFGYHYSGQEFSIRFTKSNVSKRTNIHLSPRDILQIWGRDPFKAQLPISAPVT